MAVVDCNIALSSFVHLPHHVDQLSSYRHFAVDMVVHVLAVASHRLIANNPTPLIRSPINYRHNNLIAIGVKGLAIIKSTIKLMATCLN